MPDCLVTYDSMLSTLSASPWPVRPFCRVVQCRVEPVSCGVAQAGRWSTVGAVETALLYFTFWYPGDTQSSPVASVGLEISAQREQYCISNQYISNLYMG